MLLVMSQLLIFKNPKTGKETTFIDVSDVVLNSSLYDQIATLTVKIPLKRGFDRSEIVVDSAVEWYSGYANVGNGKLNLEFSGFVSEVSPKTSENKPLEIICRDTMHLAQRISMKQNINNEKLQSVLDSLLSNLNLSQTIAFCDPTSIESKRISSQCKGKSIRWFFSDLKRFGIFVTFQNGLLFCNAPTLVETYPEITEFKIGEPNLDDFFKGALSTNSVSSSGVKPFGLVIEDKLITRIESKIQILVNSYNPKSGKAILGKYPNDSKLYEQSKDYTIDNLTQRDANTKAKDIYIEIAGSGFRGSFVTFGFPYIYHSEIIRVVDNFDSSRTRDTFVSKVVKTYNAEKAQFRQEIFPDIINFKKLSSTKPRKTSTKQAIKNG